MQYSRSQRNGSWFSRNLFSNLSLSFLESVWTDNFLELNSSRFVHSNVRRNCETFLIDSELSEVIDEMENIRENTRVRKSVMDTREQLEHGCAKSFRDRGAIYTRETKTPNRGVKI